MDSKQLRQKIRRQRYATTLEYRQMAAQKISQLLLQTQIYQTSQHIACYFAHHGEVATDTIIQSIWAQNKYCYLPVLLENQLSRMDFANYQPDTPLFKNRLGILEPKLTKENILHPQQLDLALLPLVAFDQKGTRLGMGAGFYDRSFEFILSNALKVRPILVGLAYAFQEVDHLTRNPWDVPLDMVITEDKVFML